MFIDIQGRKIGRAHPVFIAAELSCNHLQKFDLAVKTIKAIKRAGADAVKTQAFTADTITLNCKNNFFKIKQGSIWDGQYLHALYRKAATPWKWQPKLKKIAEDLGLVFFSSPFDKGAVDFLEEIGVAAYKIASFEITDIPLIEYAASKKKPLILSTGVAYKREIKEAVGACRKKGNNKIALLKCVSAYPAPLNEMNLSLIPRLYKDFKCAVGISDHTLGVSVPVAAVSLGAKIIEKHFILHRNLKSLDAAFSLEPEEFALMVKSVREAEKALGDNSYKLAASAQRSREFSRSLFAVKDIEKGQLLGEGNIKSIRPGFGLHPRYLQRVLGKRAKRKILRGQPLRWDMILLKKSAKEQKRKTRR